MPDGFPDARNYTIQKVRSYIDYMAVALLCGVLAIDRVPTTWLLIGAILLAALLKYRLNRKLKTLEVDQELDILRGSRGADKVIFKQADQGKNNAYVDAYLQPLFIVLPIDLLRRPKSYVRSIIAHERAHVSRRDTVTTFLYSTITRFLGPGIVTLPLFLPIYAILGWFSATAILGVIPVLIYYSPALYLYATRRNYLYRRELMADAEAAHQLGEEYKSFILPAKQRERYIKRETSGQSDTHPTFSERWRCLSGEQKTSPEHLFWLCLLCSFAGVFAMFGLGLNLTYDPQNDLSTEFHLTKSVVAMTVFSIWGLNYLRVLRFICDLRKNGLSIEDRIAGMIGFVVGAVLMCFFVIIFFGFPYACYSCDILTRYLVNIVLFILFLMIFCGLQAASSWFDKTGFLAKLVPAIVLAAVINNGLNYVYTPVLEAEQSEAMLSDSISFVFLLFAYALFLDVLLTALASAVKRIR